MFSSICGRGQELTVYLHAFISARAGGTGKFCFGCFLVCFFFFTIIMNYLIFLSCSLWWDFFFHSQVLVCWGVLNSIPHSDHEVLVKFPPTKVMTSNMAHGMPWGLLGATVPGRGPTALQGMASGRLDFSWEQHWSGITHYYLPAWCKFPTNICHMSE